MSIQLKKEVNLIKVNKRLLLICGLTLVVMILVQVVVLSTLGTKSSEIQSIRTSQSELRMQNEIINAQIDQVKTLSHIKSESLEQNLTKLNINFLNEINNELAGGFNAGTN